MTAADQQSTYKSADTAIQNGGVHSNDVKISVNIGLPSPTSDSGVGLSSESSTPETNKALDSYIISQSSPEAVPEEFKSESVPKPAPVAMESMNGHVFNGPDEVLPAESHMSWRRDQPVQIHMEETGPLSHTPISVESLFLNTRNRIPNKTAIGVKRDGAWKTWTYAQYYDDTRIAAKGMIALGLEPYHGVGIIGFNSPEWFLSDLGAIFAGGFAVGVYTTNSPEACHYVAENSECNIIVVENDSQLQKILQVWDRLPHLRAVIQYTGQLKAPHDNVYTWEQFMDIGRKGDEAELEARIKMQAPNKACTLIYTSGTTGNPKGVMLSHDNITWTARVCSGAAKFVYGEECSVSYLPLSHIAAQMLDIYFPIFTGGALYFAQPDALKGSLSETLKEIRPTLFFGVPRVWEKMQEKMVAIGKQNSKMKRKIAIWAKDKGYRGNIAIMNGLPGKPKRGSVPFGFGIANKLIFKKVRAALGMDRCRYCLTGAAPITKDTLDFFLSLNIQLLELYGMSESTGPHTISFPWKFRITGVGTCFPGASTKLDNPDKDGNGEICMAGRHVFMGYLNNQEKTEEALDANGHLHTGDIGKEDQDDYLYITGRIKELIITAGGENVAPVPIEDLVKEALPVISGCMLIGDKKKFLSILLSLKTDVDPDSTVPKDNLTPVAIEWCKSIGSNATTVTEILTSKDEKVLKAIQAGIDVANKKCPSRAQKIQKWSILPKDFSIPGGELGPTLKLRRPIVAKMYGKTIEAFYA